MSRASLNPSGVVLGLRQNGLGVARALGRQGVSVIAVDPAVNTPHSHTRYADTVACPGLRDDRLIQTLCEIGQRLDTPGVLIPTTDRSVDLVSEHRQKIEPYFIHSLPSADTVRQLMDKTTIAHYAEQEGFSIPRTFAIWNQADLERAVSALEFPCILKPQLKSEALLRLHVAKAFRIKSLDELRRTYKGIAPTEPRFVLQQWIAGLDTSLIFCLYYFNSAGVPLASFTGRKLRQFIPYCGTACAAEPWEDDYVRDAGIRFFQRCGYRGFGAIEFKRSPSGEYFLMEPTVGRTEHLFALAAANGINLPYIGYCDMAGMPVPPAMPKARTVRYIDWKRDRKAAQTYLRAGDLRVIEWLASLRGETQYALFAWDDLGPWRCYVMDRLQAPMRVIQRFAHSRRPGLARVAVHDAGLLMRRWTRRSSCSAEEHLTSALGWLVAAHDAPSVGGVARAYTMRATGDRQPGWQPAYPETTGYIIPTFFDCAANFGRTDLHQRAIGMADWLLTVQSKNGGIHGGVVGKGWPVVVFNTGMVLHGWCRSYRETVDPRYLTALQRAADFLVATQDADGAWRRFSNIGGTADFHAYDVLVSWPLMMAFQITGDDRLREAAVRNLEFTLQLQRPNGWLDANGLVPGYNHQPLTHAIGYAAAGFLQCGILLGETRYVDAADRIADQMQRRLHTNGWLSGEFRADWNPAANWSCLTGNAQMAIVWLRLGRLNGKKNYLEAAHRANTYLRARQDLTSANVGIRGGIAGSQPINARYGRFQYLNWAAKFFADALQQELCGETRQTVVAERQAVRPSLSPGSQLM